MVKPKILQSFVLAEFGLRFDEFQTRRGTIEFFLVDVSTGRTLAQGSLGQCIERAVRAVGWDAEWVHGEYAGPEWEKAQALNDKVVRSTWGRVPA